MLAFVEGSMERQFLNRNFKYLRVVPVSNGISWSVDQLCNQIIADYRVYDKPTDAFVWLDREARTETAEEVRHAIIASLEEAGVTKGHAHVLVNDRMSENVILADESVMKLALEDNKYQYLYEGRNGKRIMKDFFKARGDHYSEMFDGVALLKKIRLHRSALTSPAVKSFFDSYNDKCWWINEAG